MNGDILAKDGIRSDQSLGKVRHASPVPADPRSLSDIDRSTAVNDPQTVCVVLGPEKSSMYSSEYAPSISLACGLAAGHASFTSFTKAMPDRLLAQESGP